MRFAVEVGEAKVGIGHKFPLPVVCLPRFIGVSSRNWRELWVTITGNFLKALIGNPQLQIGVFTDTALVKERHYLLRLQV